jgi:hypothetical protein
LFEERFLYFFEIKLITYQSGKILKRNNNVLGRATVVSRLLQVQLLTGMSSSPTSGNHQG